MAIEAPPAPISSATVKEVRIVEGARPKDPPAPTREIKMSQLAELPGEVRGRPGAPEKPRMTLRENLESKAKPIGGQIDSLPGDPPKPKPAEKPAATPAEEGDEPTGDEPAPPAGQPAAPAADLDPKTGKPKKANPWKLYDAEKKARAQAEDMARRLLANGVIESFRVEVGA